MITVRVRILGALARPGDRDDFEVELVPSSRVSDLLARVGYQPQHQRFILTAVNGEQRKHNTPLADRDEVTLVMPTSGG